MTAPVDLTANSDRALLVLSVLAQSTQAMTAVELVAATGLAKSTLYRQIAVLRRWGFVMESDGRYSPGPATTGGMRSGHHDIEVDASSRAPCSGLWG